MSILIRLCAASLGFLSITTCGQTTNNALRQELFLNLPGACLADLINHSRFPGQPDWVDVVTAFEGKLDATENFGVRLSGYVVPQSSGQYVFDLSASGQSVLFLSLDEHAENKRPIAFAPGNVPPECVLRTDDLSSDGPAGHVSQAMWLVQGQAYFTEALMTAGKGGDHLAVAWRRISAPAPTNGAPAIEAKCLALSPPPTSYPTTGAAIPELARCDYEMLRCMRSSGIRAGTQALMKDGRLVLGRGYGWQDKAKTKPMAAEGRMRLCSITKVFTASAIKELIAQGKLSANTEAFPYLELSPFNGKLGDPRLSRITVGQLLNHQGGWNRDQVGDFIERMPEISTALGLDHPATAEEVLRYVLSQPLQFAPGASFTYSNAGYVVLARLLEKAASRPFYDVVYKEVLRPWGIARPYPIRTAPELRALDEPEYSDSDGVMGQYMPDFPTTATANAAYGGHFYLEAWDGNGGLVASASDVLRLAQGYCGPQGFNAVEHVTSGDPRRTRHLARLVAHNGALPGIYTIYYSMTNGVDWCRLLTGSPNESAFDLNAVINAAAALPASASELGLAADHFQVDENDGLFRVAVPRTGDSRGSASVEYRVIPESAAPGADYDPVSGTLTYADDEITRYITVPILDNARVDGPRSFLVQLSDAANAKLGITSARVTIEDDESWRRPRVALLSPSVGPVVRAQGDVLLVPQFEDQDGQIETVLYYAGSARIGERNKAPYAFEWKRPAEGTYLFTAQAIDRHGLSATSAPVSVAIGQGLTTGPAGKILRQFWTRRPGSVLSNLTGYANYPSHPTGQEYLESFEVEGRGEYFGARLSGFVHPPVSGEYAFWIAADDRAELWLSTDDALANRRLIAQVLARTGPREWTKAPEQQSFSIPLLGGRRYYVEVLHKQVSGPGHVAVGWQCPNGQEEKPIPGSRLSPADPEGFPVWDQPVWSENGLTIRVKLPPDIGYRLESSTDLRTWEPLDIVEVIGQWQEFKDLSARRDPRRFYRAAAIK